MVQTVELLPDEATDAYIRQQWQALTRAGLPSAGRNPAPSVRPHVTLAVATSIRETAEAALREHGRAALPIELHLAGYACFDQTRPGISRFVLVRLVTASVELLRLQGAIARTVGISDAFAPTMAPGRWVPHITLARAVRPSQMSRAVELLAGSRPPPGHGVRLRRWDGEGKREWSL